MTKGLGGVIAAITTPFDADGEPDTDRFVARARYLLEEGCDGLNVLGTTGEATSLSVAQRERVMRAAAAALPLGRLMVGTGAAAVADTLHLTALAASLGFAGALVLPPFYYKTVANDGIVRYFARIVAATTDVPIPLYLYNFPALTGIAYTPDLVRELLDRFGDRIAGLKDSSGDVPYAREIAGLSDRLAVFPSNEANLDQAGPGQPFAGCISATANVNAAYCAAAFRNHDAQALATATAVRGLFGGLALVPSIKALVAAIEDDSAHARTMPPLTDIAQDERDRLFERFQLAVAHPSLSGAAS